jgi:hypothetical protein
LLQNAIRRTLQARETLGVHAVLVEAKNSAAEGFYRKYGFRLCDSKSRQLYLPLGVEWLASKWQAPPLRNHTNAERNSNNWYGPFLATEPGRILAIFSRVFSCEVFCIIQGWEIWLLSPNKPPQRLTNHPALEYDPTSSPDDRYIVFTSERSGVPDLFVIGAKVRAFRRFVQASPLPSHFYRFAPLNAILSGDYTKVAHARSAIQFSYDAL